MYLVLVKYNTMTNRSKFIFFYKDNNINNEIKGDSNV